MNLLKSVSLLGCVPKQNLLTKRFVSFGTSQPADRLWASVKEVSAAGKRRGRGKVTSKIKIKDFHKFRTLGVGKLHRTWIPGLTQSSLESLNVKTNRGPTLSRRTEEDIASSEVQTKRPSISLPRLMQGITSKSYIGLKIGPPVIENKLQEDSSLRSIVLYSHQVGTMKAVIGQSTRFQCFVCVGNGTGLVGVGSSKGAMMKQAALAARNNVMRRLHLINLQNGTIMHPFWERETGTIIHAEPRRDNGLKCHRSLQMICEMAGIENIHVKIHGNVNVVNAIKAFFRGLTKQKQFEKIVAETGLSLIEYPPQLGGQIGRVVVKSPQTPTQSEVEEVFEKAGWYSDEGILPLGLHTMEGEVLANRNMRKMNVRRAARNTLRNEFLIEKKMLENDRVFRLYANHDKLKGRYHQYILREADCE